MCSAKIQHVLAWTWPGIPQWMHSVVSEALSWVWWYVAAWVEKVSGRWKRWDKITQNTGWQDDSQSPGASWKNSNMIMIQAPVQKKKKKITQSFWRKKRGWMVGGTALARTVAGLQRTKEQQLLKYPCRNICTSGILPAEESVLKNKEHTTFWILKSIGVLTFVRLSL